MKVRLPGISFCGQGCRYQVDNAGYPIDARRRERNYNSLMGRLHLMSGHYFPDSDGCPLRQVQLAQELGRFVAEQPAP